MTRRNKGYEDQVGLGSMVIAGAHLQLRATPRDEEGPAVATSRHVILINTTYHAWNESSKRSL
jgi:hypothetical protein